MKKTVIAGLIALTSASAFAATDIFAALDVNEDNMLSAKEASIDTTLAAIFNDLDGDKDGYVSKQEFSVLLQR
ncbi:CREC-EF hand family protein [Paraglaciecola polaris]|uniref:Calcium-binding EF-hand n=1 Tax=Paraglaciecola polaris LMG 21857 TaxID=1129793 RepID=K6Z769_9ALTE|nr:EF-hand domain-containing protein [Paraglaciecola polaris]GAC32051.1 calcium-binding EF-hand [Paraglaciecola polaris LMG 21857]|tara:strand:+ start:19641 stop:19859 length:219 start_codon:yes stop_codon:yes gene_type:complete